MSGEIGAALQGMKVIYEIVKANKGLLNYNELVSAVAEVNGKLVEAQAVTLASQEKQTTLSNRVSELEKEIVELKNWNHEAKRYQLTELCAEVFVHTLKAGMENSEPFHKICTACYNKRQKGYLHRSDFDSQGTHYICDNCCRKLTDHSRKLIFPDIGPVEPPDYF